MKTYADSKPQIWDAELFHCALPRNLVGRLTKLTAFSPCLFSIFYHSAKSSSRQRRPHYRGFTITLRHATLGRSPLDEWSARHRYLYLITHKTHRRHTSMPPVGFKPLIPESEGPQTHALRPRGHWDRPLYFEIRHIYWWFPLMYIYIWHKQM
jgi:hypothetical protein